MNVVVAARHIDEAAGHLSIVRPGPRMVRLLAVVQMSKGGAGDEGLGAGSVADRLAIQTVDTGPNWSCHT